LVGRTIKSFPRFTYSIAMEALTGRWDEEALNAFIAHPMATVPGTRMNIDGLGAANECADLIAYLRSLKSKPSPYGSAPSCQGTRGSLRKLRHAGQARRARLACKYREAV
jgi:cytochrome c